MAGSLIGLITVATVSKGRERELPRFKGTREGAVAHKGHRANRTLNTCAAHDKMSPNNGRKLGGFQNKMAIKASGVKRMGIGRRRAAPGGIASLIIDAFKLRASDIHLGGVLCAKTGMAGGAGGLKA
jgi:hypothetical protein